MKNLASCIYAKLKKVYRFFFPVRHTPSLLEQTIIVNMPSLMGAQFHYNIVVGYDIYIKYLAIDSYFGNNPFGKTLLAKMYKSIYSGQDTPEAEYKFYMKVASLDRATLECAVILCNENLHVVSGTDEIAFALYHNIRSVPVRLCKDKTKVYNYFWLTENAFTAEEINHIVDCQNKITHRLNEEASRLLSKNHQAKLGELYNIYYSSESIFGDGYFYQSFEPLGIYGKRPTQFRFNTYKLNEYLDSSKSVLDIGCNIGFFSLYTSQFVKHVEGLELNESLVKIGKRAKEEIGITNCDFLLGDFNYFAPDKKYDAIFSFAVHRWIGMKMDEYGAKVHGILNDNGIVIFESHDLEVESDIDEKINAFTDGRFIKINEGYIKDDFIYGRRFYILRKA